MVPLPPQVELRGNHVSRSAETSAEASFPKLSKSGLRSADCRSRTLITILSARRGRPKSRRNVRPGSRAIKDVSILPSKRFPSQMPRFTNIGLEKKAVRAALTWGMALGPERRRDLTSRALLSAAKQVASNRASASRGTGQGSRLPILRCHGAAGIPPGKSTRSVFPARSGPASAPSKTARLNVRPPDDRRISFWAPGIPKSLTMAGLPGVSRTTS